jgi:hypothetical protein
MLLGDEECGRYGRDSVTLSGGRVTLQGDSAGA